LIVVDASASLGWSFLDQQTPTLLELARRVIDHGACVPQLWPIEVAAVVVRTHRRGKISQRERDAILSKLAALDVEVDEETAGRLWRATVDLAVKHGLSVYDATYLELALRKQLPFATLDDKLIVAARAEGLTVLP